MGSTNSSEVPEYDNLMDTIKDARTRQNNLLKCLMKALEDVDNAPVKASREYDEACMKALDGYYVSLARAKNEYDIACVKALDTRVVSLVAANDDREMTLKMPDVIVSKIRERTDKLADELYILEKQLRDHYGINYGINSNTRIPTRK